MTKQIPPTVLAFGKRHGLSAADLETLKKALRPLDIQDMATRRRVVEAAERILTRLEGGQLNNASTPEGRAVIESARREGTSHCHPPKMTREWALSLLTGGYPESANFNQQLFVDNAIYDGWLVASRTDAEVLAAYARWQTEVDKA